MDTSARYPIRPHQPNLHLKFLCSALIAILILYCAYSILPRFVSSLRSYIGREEIKDRGIHHKSRSGTRIIFSSEPETVFDAPKPILSSPKAASPIPKSICSFYALVIGINDYSNLDRLGGAVADADRVALFLATELQVPSDQIANLRNKDASRAAIIEGLYKLRDDPRISHGDPILIYYAGHGGSKRGAIMEQAWGRMNEMQVIFPQDYGEYKARSNDRINCIPDYTIAALLDELAEKKGNNITVVFDSCHSASGSRGGFEGSSALQPRCAPILYDIPPDLDANIKRSSESKISRSVDPLLCTDQASHVLLAACGSREKAWEQEQRGQFTTALLTALKTCGAEKVTYHNLLISLPQLINQSPHCYGTNKSRVLFDSRVSSFKPAYIPIAIDRGALVLGAGISSGVTSESIWEVYGSTVDGSPPLGRSIAGIPRISTTVLNPLTDNHQRYILGGDLEEQTRLYARQVGAGVGNELKVWFSDQVESSLFQISDPKKPSGNPTGHEVNYVRHPQREGADLRVEIHDPNLVPGRGEVVFSLCDSLAERYGVSKLDRRKPANRSDVETVLFAAAKWNWHLRRTNTHHIENHTQSIVGMEMYKVGERTRGGHRELLQTPGPVLVKCDDHTSTGLVELIVRDRDLYGIKLSNKRNVPLHVKMFFFDATDFSIVELFGHSASNDQGDPELPASGELFIGDGRDGGSPLRFSIPPEKTNELGYLKVFWSTERLELEDIVQTSAFSLKSSRGVKSLAGGRTMKDWGTTCLTLVQYSPLGGK